MDKLKIPILNSLFKEICKSIDVVFVDNHIYGNLSEIEVFMQHMNPLFAIKYSKLIEKQGYIWNGLTRKITPTERLKKALIYLSVANEKDEGKKIAKGFVPMCFKSLEEILSVWREYSISSAIFSTMHRFSYGRWISESRRRNVNISFIGNAFIYDFDSGNPSMQAFYDTYKGKKFDFMCVKSKRDHEYEYDRFKVLVPNNLIFTHSRNDEAPEGLMRKDLREYEAHYIGFAEHMGFWKYADQSTKDLGRLCSNVSKDGEALICSTLVA